MGGCPSDVKVFTKARTLLFEAKSSDLNSICGTSDFADVFWLRATSLFNEFAALFLSLREATNILL